MNKGRFLRKVFAAFAVCAFMVFAADQVSVTLDESLNKGELDWELERDWGQNKTAAELVAVKNIEGKSGGIKLSADFTSGKGSYAAAEKKFESLKAKSIDDVRFKVRTENVKTYTLRIVDASGQTLQRRPMPILDGEWAEVVINEKTFARNEHYGGKKDGKIHQPIAKIAIALTKSSSEDKKPMLEVYDLKVKYTK